MLCVRFGPRRGAIPRVAAGTFGLLLAGRRWGPLGRVERVERGLRAEFRTLHPCSRALFVFLGWDELFSCLSRLDHGNVEPRLVFELEPELTVAISGLLRLLAEQFVIALHLVGHRIFILLDAEDHVVFEDDRGSEPAAAHVDLIDADDGVVAREAKLLVAPEYSSPVGRDVDQRLDQVAALFLVELAPGCDIGQRSHRAGPLSAQQATRWVLEVQREQEGVVFVKVLRVDVRAEAHSLHQDLSESAGVHLLGEVAADELILPLWVLSLEELFEGPENDQSLSLVGHARVELQYRLGVAFSLGLGSCSGCGHLEALVNPW